MTVDKSRHLITAAQPRHDDAQHRTQETNRPPTEPRNSQSVAAYGRPFTVPQCVADPAYPHRPRSACRTLRCSAIRPYRFKHQHDSRGRPHDVSADHQHRFPRGPLAAAHAITPRNVAAQIKQQRRSYARAVLRSLARTQQGQPTVQVNRVLRQALTPWGTPPRGNAAPTRGRHQRRTPRRLT